MHELKRHLKRRVVWSVTGQSEHPYKASVGQSTWTIRVNDFPAEPMYTLFIDGVEAGDLEDWPEAWTRPLKH